MRRALTGFALVVLLPVLTAVALAVLWLDHSHPTAALDGLTEHEAMALLGEPTNRYGAAFRPNWSRDVTLAGVTLAEKTLFLDGSDDAGGGVGTGSGAWRLPAGVFVNHSYEQGHARGLFCFTSPFSCRLEP